MGPGDFGSGSGVGSRGCDSESEKETQDKGSVSGTFCNGRSGVDACISTSVTGKDKHFSVPEKNIAAVVETDRQSGQRKLCRVSCLVFRYPKDILPFASDCDIKYDWLEEDVCALTGRDTAGNVQQYLATYGARGSLTSYMDPYVPMHGNWQGYDAAGNEWRVTVSSGVGVVKGGEQWLFGESECERYGTIGMTLGKGSDARFSLIMNKDCREEDGMLMDGGTLTLCRISVDRGRKNHSEKSG